MYALFTKVHCLNFYFKICLFAMETYYSIIYNNNTFLIIYLYWNINKTNKLNIGTCTLVTHETYSDVTKRYRLNKPPYNYNVDILSGIQ